MTAELGSRTNEKTTEATTTTDFRYPVFAIRDSGPATSCQRGCN